MDDQAPGQERKERRAAVEAAAQRLGSWMEANAKAPSTIRKQKAVLRSVLRICGPESPDIEALPGTSVLEKAIALLPDWQKQDGSLLARVLAEFSDDVAWLSRQCPFPFAEINPGLGALGLAATRCGGIVREAEEITPLAVGPYRAFHGRTPLMEPEEVTPEVVLVNLPFSLFLSGDRPDPEVTGILSSAARKSRRIANFLFRVDWTTGSRIGVDPAVYTSLIERFFPAPFELETAVLENAMFVPMEGKELFIAVSRQMVRSFLPVLADPAPIPASQCVMNVEFASFDQQFDIEGRRFPDMIARRIEPDYFSDPSAAVVATAEGRHRRLLPAEVAAILGMPAHYPFPGRAESAYQLLGVSAAVPVAERAVRGFMRAAGIE